DPRGAGIVVAMASHVHQEKLVAILRLELARKFLDLNARNDAVNTILPVKPEAIAYIAGQCKREHDLQHVTSRVKCNPQRCKRAHKAGRLPCPAKETARIAFSCFRPTAASSHSRPV